MILSDAGIPAQERKIREAMEHARREAA